MPSEPTLGARLLNVRRILISLFDNLLYLAREGNSFGAGRVARAYVRITLRYLLSRVLRTTLQRERFLGLSVWCPDYNSLRLLFEEIFVREVYWIPASPKLPMTVIDCGANFGMSALYFKKLHPISSVIAFEPDARAFELLQRNVRDNDLEDVVLHQTAITAHDGEVRFHSEGNASLTGSVMAERGGKDAVAVPSRRLSPYITRPVSLLKIDIEGAEREVLAELHASGRLGLVENIALEYHHHLAPNDDEALVTLLEVLTRNGFVIQLDASHQPHLGPRFQDVQIYGLRLTDRSSH